ncbi:MAG: DUF4367 domain-containing protein [Ruminococcaceae bacterium]|nr:DUF4367 domain-containing protein [Oscillospiraceae bacterium]
MSNENNYYDKVLDLLVDEALEADLNEELDEYEAMEEHVFSKRHEDEMKKILNKQSRRVSYKRKARIAVYIACALLLASGAVVFGVSAWRNSVLNFFLDLDAPNSEFSYSDGIDNSYKDDNIEFNYLPDKFVLTEKYISDEKSRYYFTHSQEYITLSISNVEGSFAVDTEDSNTEDIIIGEMPGKYIEKGNQNIVIWSKKNIHFLLLSNIEKQELINIANGIIK